MRTPILCGESVGYSTHGHPQEPRWGSIVGVSLSVGNASLTHGYPSRTPLGFATPSSFRCHHQKQSTARSFVARKVAASARRTSPRCDWTCDDEKPRRGYTCVTGGRALATPPDNDAIPNCAEGTTHNGNGLLRLGLWRICAVPSALTIARTLTGGSASLNPRLRKCNPFGVKYVPLRISPLRYGQHPLNLRQIATLREVDRLYSFRPTPTLSQARRNVRVDRNLIRCLLKPN